MPTLLTRWQLTCTESARLGTAHPEPARPDAIRPAVRPDTARPAVRPDTARPAVRPEKERRDSARIDAVEAAGRDLLARWAEPHRHYHDLRHLTAVLDVVDEYADAARHPDRVRLAAWFHDAVYDPRAPGDANERASADLAHRVLATFGLPPDVVADVARLVLLTATHDPAPDDPDGMLLCDADLAVLARSPADYDAYAAAVRREYAHVPDEAFRAGRAAVLRRLLDRPVLYRVIGAWETPARANLARELAAR